MIAAIEKDALDLNDVQAAIYRAKLRLGGSDLRTITRDTRPTPSGSLAQQMLALAAYLDAFNNSTPTGCIPR